MLVDRVNNIEFDMRAKSDEEFKKSGVQAWLSPGVGPGDLEVFEDLPDIHTDILKATPSDLSFWFDTAPLFEAPLGTTEYLGTKIPIPDHERSKKYLHNVYGDGFDQLENYYRYEVDK